MDPSGELLGSSRLLLSDKGSSSLEYRCQDQQMVRAQSPASGLDGLLAHLLRIRETALLGANPCERRQALQGVRMLLAMYSELVVQDLGNQRFCASEGQFGLQNWKNSWLPEPE